MTIKFRQRIQDILTVLPIKGDDALKQLFWTELNYDRANSPLSTRDWPVEVSDAIYEPPLLFASAGDSDGFHIIYTHLDSDKLLLGKERRVIRQLINEHPYALYIFSNKSETYWHFVNVKYEHGEGTKTRRIFRRITVSREERLRTATERLSLIDVSTMSRDLFGISPLAIQHRQDEAFDVEAVTQKFFEDYQKIFNGFQTELRIQTNDQAWAHDFALQFINRVMFLYYVQRKQWLGKDSDFLNNFWQAYGESTHTRDTFVNDWLDVLFFEAFNEKYQAGRKDREYFPSWIKEALALAPFLNGGLFTKNDLDRKHRFNISDRDFEIILDFLEKYNFTISEDTPLDQEVAVDPEMIGKVYESLVNVSEETDERSEAGIFYTPRVEIDLMCRLSLVDWLTNLLGEGNKSLLYELIFAFEDDDKTVADNNISERNLWPQLNEYLRGVSVVDPACGSGSFLVGMLYVLDELIARSNTHLGIEETPYERKRTIIRESLFGVDVMRWAVEVAELRLWLQLVIDTQLEPPELKFQPLLPNLSFKIRPGDSLVQEVGGINLANLKGGTIPSHLKGKITNLRGEKAKFYNNERDRKYKTERELQQAERLIFCELIVYRISAIKKRISELEHIITPQKDLFGNVQTSQLELEAAKAKREIETKQQELENVTKAYAVLQTEKSVPFVWDIAFVEIFRGDRKGFDIVIGNPPYVRNEKIRNPLQPIEKATTASKRTYKKKLAKAVYQTWPLSFGYKGKQPKWKLAGRSDLYIYFYLYCLSLLNEKGSFCFITSNSWLDVGYGKDLQEFLLTRSQVKMIVDNQERRSFASADINTVIALFSAAYDSKTNVKNSLDHIARFVMFKVPFEQTLTPIIWEEVEEAELRKTTPEYRVYPEKQSILINSGWDTQIEAYSGDKWGGEVFTSTRCLLDDKRKRNRYADSIGGYR